MPIRPENKDRYPTDWPEISAKVREEAGQCCEWCKVLNGAMIRRSVTKPDKIPVYRMADSPDVEDARHADNGDIVPGTAWDDQDWRKPVKVVLTVAHMDHQPENCARDNLKALCQRCHNKYDAPMRRRGIEERKRAANARADLFRSEEDPA